MEISFENFGKSKKVLHLTNYSLELTGIAVRNRFLIHVGSQPIELPARSFKFLLLLAMAKTSPAKYKQGWIYKTDIEPTGIPARYLYRMKRELLNALDPGNPFGAWNVYENDGCGNYRLTCPAEWISINWRNLEDHFDFQVRELARLHIDNF